MNRAPLVLALCVLATSPAWANMHGGKHHTPPKNRAEAIQRAEERTEKLKAMSDEEWNQKQAERKARMEKRKEMRANRKEKRQEHRDEMKDVQQEYREDTSAHH